jgi:hypothetical protein
LPHQVAFSSSIFAQLVLKYNPSAFGGLKDKLAGGLISKLAGECAISISSKRMVAAPPLLSERTSLVERLPLTTARLLLSHGMSVSTYLRLRYPSFWPMPFLSCRKQGRGRPERGTGGTGNSICARARSACNIAILAASQPHRHLPGIAGKALPLELDRSVHTHYV